jgi:hypothetical protein
MKGVIIGLTLFFAALILLLFFVARHNGDRCERWRQQMGGTHGYLNRSGRCVAVMADHTVREE